VKQIVSGGTATPSPTWTNAFFGGKPGFSSRDFCERNAGRFFILRYFSFCGEQTTGCPVFYYVHV